jgi:hypothetical protein
MLKPMGPLLINSNMLRGATAALVSSARILAVLLLENT